MAKKNVLLAVGLIALVLLAAKLLLPSYVTSLQQALQQERDGIVQQDLFAMRTVIRQYTLDKNERPHSLDDLVVAGYLKNVPTDPTTGRKDTWVVECSKDPKAPGMVGIDASSGNIGTRTIRCVAKR
jgi:general secretion pathway protein G